MTSGLFFSSESDEPSRAQRALRVLIADDERDIVLTLMAILRDEGYETKGVYSGKDVLAAVAEFDPDAVLLDIAMPGMTGWDVARQIRRLHPGDRPRLVALSGQYTQGADKILAQMTGFDGYLTKPCDPKVIVALLATTDRPA